MPLMLPPATDRPSGMGRRLLRAVARLRPSGATRLVRWLAPSPGVASPFEIDAFGVRFTGDLSDHVDWYIYWFGAYAPEELALLADCADALGKSRGPLCFYDIGANTGQHALFMSRKVAQVHAFEPSSAIAIRLAHNIAANDIRNLVLHRVALSNADGEGQLGSGLPGNSGSRSLDWTLDGQGGEPVAVRDAERYLAEHQLPRIDLLKLDVEGHERKVLSSLRERLNRDRPVILMELIGLAGTQFRDEEELRALLYPGHRLVSLRGWRGRPQLVAFDWACDAAVVLPEEIADTICV